MDYNQKSVPHTACAVCGHVLNRYTGAFGESWIHVLETDDDHPPVPVPVASIHTTFMCDFCLDEGAHWALPVEDYDTIGGGKNVGDWAVCDGCAALLRAGKWEKLTTRAIKAMQKRHNGELPERQHFDLMYGELRKHIIGELRPA